MAEAERRRRRHRHHGGHETGVEEGARATTPAVHDGGGGDPPPRGRRGGATDEGERGLRGLVGSGSSQVSVTAAMRARDAARPTEEDLAEAAARLTIVRRNWTPREELPRR
ncbi:hypothetical protein Jiend_41140 [Micromonospora endophytica]|uniref:hypothetical protein n=1 Tax=Micromonospora endophytica TaxID=515350 RepID=UPI000E67E27A|nr:hypothetical protein [Micromonospora endophytica]RIW42633.1 hypothetical protein D3H59_22580 [Micromonospora endophytica]BCJ60692.1 hypothetical protein Jiend_41140 [Micromonospora endophytica]